ncbi:MAG: glycosyltransferase family 2 protein [Bacteroidales bacterium]|nr:glycosyltransferase family 2 protein [Bacteroidales bacterium]
MISVIIPMFNNWNLSYQCLLSLAKTTENEDIEVIAVDNASTDATRNECRSFGESLFPERFFYLRQGENRNYAGANNIAAAQARGNFLFLLNNDTIAQEGWLPPLRKAMEEDPSLGAVGPLLLYPKSGGDHSVQHLGVAISINRQVTHFYESFPYPHRLLGRKRFFQVITGAALFMPRERYLALGGLNEDFRNGFEDVELCYRLCEAGFRQTVVAESVILHYGGRSAGRNAHETANAALCGRLCPHLLIDEPRLYRDDGYVPVISPWLTLDATLSSPKKIELLRVARTGSLETLQEAVRDEPYWIEGAILLARKYEAAGQLKDAFNVLARVCRFRGTPETLIPFCRFLQSIGQREAMEDIIAYFQEFAITPEERIETLTALRKQFVHIDDEIVSQIDNLLRTNSHFFSNLYPQICSFLS